MNTTSRAGEGDADQIADDLRTAAVWALADLQARAPQAVSWYVPQSPPGLLVGACRAGQVTERLDIIDAWAALLGVTAEWRELPVLGGEYVAEATHLGARVSVRTWLPVPPCVVELGEPA